MNLLQIALLALALTMSLRLMFHFAIALGMVVRGDAFRPRGAWWSHFSLTVASIVAFVASVTGVVIW